MKDADKGHQRFDFKSSHAKLGTQKSDEGNDRYVFEQLGFVRLNIRAVSYTHLTLPTTCGV